MRSFLNCLAFLTIIKIPKKYYFKKEFSSTLIYFPLAGFIIGIFLVIFYALLNLFLPSILAAFMAVGFEAILTGGMHYDGLSDVFDGIFSGRSGGDIYEIMKKSDIGAFGVLAILFSVILKAGFIYYLYFLTKGNIIYFYILFLFMPVFGKWSMVYLLSFYKPVKKKSLSALFEPGSKKMFIYSSIYTFFVFFTANIFTGFLKFKGLKSSFFIIKLFPFFIAFIIFFLNYILLYILAKFFTSKIGGLNGDIVGATSQIIEISYLFFAIAFIVLFSYF